MAPTTFAPLAGVRVVESSLLGPAAITTHLADLGADVIKVESPAGDYVREMTWPIIKGVSMLHMHVNRGKKSLTLDLKKPEAVEVYPCILFCPSPRCPSPEHGQAAWWGPRRGRMS